jgi:outer membrane protein assembly factor BamB
LRTVLLDVKTGRVLSEIDFGGRGPTVNAATPLAVGDDRYLLTASYGIGAHLVKVSGQRLERIWKKPDLLASQYNSPVMIGDSVVGVHGREDQGEVALRVLSLNEPKVLKESALPGPAHLIAVGQQLLQVAINGELALSEVSAGRMTTKAKLAATETSRGQKGVFRALPAFSKHVLIVRSTTDARSGEFIAYQLP